MGLGFLDLPNIIIDQVKDYSNFKKLRSEFSEVMAEKGLQDAKLFFLSRSEKLIELEQYTGEKPELFFVSKSLKQYFLPILDELKREGAKVDQKQFDMIQKEFHKNFMSIKSVWFTHQEGAKKFLYKRGEEKYNDFVENLKNFLVDFQSSNKA